MKKRFLVVVDMQNDFIDGALGTPEAQSIVAPAAAYIRKRKELGDICVATMDTHGPDYMETREGRFLPVPHCLRGTKGWQIQTEIKQALGDFVTIEKPTFGSNDLVRYIQDRIGSEDSVEIELIGLCTDICVVSNALLLKASFPEADIYVRPECCAGVTPEKHEAALETMASCQIYASN